MALGFACICVQRIVFASSHEPLQVLFAWLQYAAPLVDVLRFACMVRYVASIILFCAPFAMIHREHLASLFWSSLVCVMILLFRGSDMELQEPKNFS